jgi:hypothetical protein
LRGPARVPPDPDARLIEGWMQARDPKRDRPAGPPGRPAFGVGPIARVARPPDAGRRPELDRPGDQAAASSAAPARPTTPIRTAMPGRPGTAVRSPFPAMPPTRGFGLPNLRRNVCPHFYMTGSRGAIPIQAPHLLKALIRQDANVSRCQLRGGVHLEQGYVNDVCLTPRFNQCVFYEDDLTRE